MNKADKVKAVQALFTLAEKRGSLSVADIKKHIPDIKDSKEELDGWIALFREMDIDVISCYGKGKSRGEKKSRKKLPVFVRKKQRAPYSI